MPNSHKKDDFCAFIYLSRGLAYNQLLFSLKTGTFPILEGYPDTKLGRFSVMAFFGHEIDDPDVLEYCKERDKEKPPMGFFGKIMMPFAIIFMLIVPPRRLKKVIAEYIGSYNLLKEFQHLKSSKGVLEDLFANLYRHTDASKNHAPCSFGSSMKCSLLKSVLESAKS
jgi:hypothetical protein